MTFQPSFVKKKKRKERRSAGIYFVEMKFAHLNISYRFQNCIAEGLKIESADSKNPQIKGLKIHEFTGLKNPANLFVQIEH